MTTTTPTTTAPVEPWYEKDWDWVVAEVKKGWAALETVEQTAIVDVNGLLAWLKSKQASVQQLLATILKDLPLVGGVVSAIDPAAAPLVAAATPIAITALDAGEAALDALAQHVIDGTTPLSAITSTVQTVQAAENAVKNVVGASVAKPATVTPAAAAAPVTPVAS